MIVNLNCLCKVRLSEFGKVIWMSQIDSVSEDTKKTNPQVIESIKNAIDPYGFISLQLWVLMTVFGPYMYSTSSPFASQTIDLLGNPKFKVLS